MSVVASADSQIELQSLPDLDSSAHIRDFIEAFYRRLLADQQLAPVFLDVANIDLPQHLGHICRYWEKLLLGSTDYRRHTMNIHRQLDAKQALTGELFQRWLQLFNDTLRYSYAGPKADRAVTVAASIAVNMHRALGSSGCPLR